MHGCTAIARNYLAHASVLAQSFLEHHPHATFTVLVVDADGTEPRTVGPADVLVPTDCGIAREELHRMALMYSTQGLVSALKPTLARELLARDGAPVLFLDADSCVYGALDDVARLAAEHTLVVTPHTTHPLGPPDTDGREREIMRWGVMNGGFFAVGPGAEPFLAWWSQRMARYCVIDRERSLAYSQPWLTLAVAAFQSAVLRDPGVNASGWSLSDEVEWRDDRPRLRGAPLRDFHFAGRFDPERPDDASSVAQTRAQWPAREPGPGTLRLRREYAGRLLDAGWRETHALPPGFTTLADGTPLDAAIRARYRAALLDAERTGGPEPPNAFTDGEAAFAAWLGSARAADVEQPQRVQLERAELENERDVLAGEVVALRREREAWLAERDALRIDLAGLNAHLIAALRRLATVVRERRRAR